MENDILDAHLYTVEEEEIIELIYAGFWIRALASFLDGLIMIPLGIFSFFAILYFKSIPLYILILIISACYKPFCEYKFGATIGKMVIDLKVVNKDFQRISQEQALIRATPFLINSIMSILFILLIDASILDDINGFFEFSAMIESSEYNWLNSLGSWPMFLSCIVVAFDSRKQGLHDKLAKTFCVYENK